MIAAVVGRDKDLDVLVHCQRHEPVRAEVALHGRDKDLDILVDDPHPFVRCAVAMFGRKCDLEKLVNDDAHDVRLTANEQYICRSPIQGKVDENQADDNQVSL